MHTIHDDMLERIKKILLAAEINGIMGTGVVDAALAAQSLVADNAAANRKPPAYVVAAAGSERSIVKANPEGTRLASVGAAWTSAWNTELAAALAPNFRCEYYFDSVQKEGDRRPRKVVRFFGQKADASAAKLVYDYLVKVVNQRGGSFARARQKELKAQTGRAVSQAALVNTWAHAFIEGIKSELDQQAWELGIYVPQLVQRTYTRISQDFVYAPMQQTKMENDQAALNAGRTCGRISAGQAGPRLRLKA